MNTRYLPSYLSGHAYVSSRLYWPPMFSRRIAPSRITLCATAAPPPPPDDRKGDDEGDNYRGYDRQGDDRQGDDRQGDDRQGDDRQGDDRQGDDEEPDPILNKFHTIDPGMLHYQRATFERLFHSAIAPLTGDELKKIMQGRRLQLTMEGSSVMLMVYTEPWSNATDDTWNGMAALLSDWSADAIVRELDLTAPFKEPMFIPLKVRRV